VSPVKYELGFYIPEDDILLYKLFPVPCLSSMPNEDMHNSRHAGGKIKLCCGSTVDYLIQRQADNCLDQFYVLAAFCV
jgi:hypothetical protein